MPRLFRSTSQPYYARKADVVGNLSDSQVDELYFLIYGDELDDKVNGPFQIFLDERDTDESGNEHNTYYNFDKMGNVYIGYSFGDSDKSFQFSNDNGTVYLYVTSDDVGKSIVMSDNGKLYNVVMNLLVSEGVINIQFPYGEKLEDLTKDRAFSILRQYLDGLECQLPATGYIKVNLHPAIITAVSIGTAVDNIRLQIVDLNSGSIESITANKTDFEVNDVKSVPIN